MWLIPAFIQVRARRRAAAPLPMRFVLPRFLLAQFASLPFITCGILIFLGNENGLYWIVPGVVVSLIATVINAWVLLVEILR
jgi:hypothetical protein